MGNKAQSDTNVIPKETMNYGDNFVIERRELNPKEYLRDKKEIKNIVLSMIEEAGYNKIIADQIISCESGYNPTARHLNSNGTEDVGIWQINSIHGMSVEDRMDIYKSTNFAIKLMGSKRGLKHWVCYNG